MFSSILPRSGRMAPTEISSGGGVAAGARAEAAGVGSWQAVSGPLPQRCGVPQGGTADGRDFQCFVVLRNSVDGFCLNRADFNGTKAITSFSRTSEKLLPGPWKTTLTTVDFGFHSQHAGCARPPN